MAILMRGDEEQRKRAFRERMNFLIKELKAGRLEITDHNRHEIQQIFLMAAYAELVAKPTLFVIADPNIKRELPPGIHEIAFQAFFKFPYQEEHGPPERPGWQKAFKPDT